MGRNRLWVMSRNFRQGTKRFGSPTVFIESTCMERHLCVWTSEVNALWFTFVFANIVHRPVYEQSYFRGHNRFNYSFCSIALVLIPTYMLCIDKKLSIKQSLQLSRDNKFGSIWALKRLFGLFWLHVGFDSHRGQQTINILLRAWLQFDFAGKTQGRRAQCVFPVSSPRSQTEDLALAHDVFTRLYRRRQIEENATCSRHALIPSSPLPTSPSVPSETSPTRNGADIGNYDLIVFTDIFQEK